MPDDADGRMPRRSISALAIETYRDDYHAAKITPRRREITSVFLRDEDYRSKWPATGRMFRSGIGNGE